MRYYLWRLKKNNRGAALLELAIIIPVLLLLILGLVEFGWIFNGYITLTGVAREGARVAAVGGDYVGAIEQHAQSLPALNASLAQISGGAEQGDDIYVRVTGSLTLIGAWPFFGETFPLAAEATFRREYRDDLDDNNDNSNGNGNNDNDSDENNNGNDNNNADDDGDNTDDNDL